MTVPVQLVTTSVLSLLSTGLAGQGVYEAGRVSATATRPYVIVQQIPGGGVPRLPIGVGVVAATVAYQVTSVGGRRDQAQWMADKVADLWEAWQASPLPAVAGWAEGDRFRTGVLPGVDVTGDAPNQVYSVVDSLAVTLIPNT